MIHSRVHYNPLVPNDDDMNAIIINKRYCALYEELFQVCVAINYFLFLFFS